MNSKARRWYFSGFVLCGVLFAGTSTAFAAQPKVDPCGVVTKAEVEQVLGTLKSTPKAETEGSAAWCIYEFANGKDAMEVWVVPADGMDRGRKRANKPASVKGLGDEAFMSRGTLGLDYVDLFIKKGSVTVKLALKATTGDEEKLRTLGQKAVGRF